MSLLIMGMCLDPYCISAKPLKEKNTVASAKGLPSTYADFKERCHTVAVTPEGAVKMYFDAVFCYLDPNRRDMVALHDALDADRDGSRYADHEIEVAWMSLQKAL